jgi:hypothetical protein
VHPNAIQTACITVLCVGRDAVEWPVLGLYLITSIGGQHLKMCIVAGQLP